MPASNLISRSSISFPSTLPSGVWVPKDPVDSAIEGSRDAGRGVRWASGALYSDIASRSGDRSVIESWTLDALDVARELASLRKNEDGVGRSG